MRRRHFLGLAAGLATLPMWSARAATGRVLCLGGSLTETVFALGAEAMLIGRDSTSTYPVAAEALPDVGYVRALSAEGVLAMAPDLILAEEDAGPPEVVDVLKASGVDWQTIDDDHTPASVVAKVIAVGAALGLTDKATALAAKIEAQLAEAATMAAAVPEDKRKRVLFILSAEGGKIMAAGAGSSAEGIIHLAGAENAAQGFGGYKALSDEAVLDAAPDLILMMDRAGDHAADNETLFALPALATSPAAEARAIVRMDGLYLLGFGPRTGQAALDLHRAIYG